MMNPVRVKCRKCGKDVKSDEFVLDPVYKMMVCAQCVKDRRMLETAEKKQTQEAVKAKAREEEKKQRPAGWDMDDAEIERAYRDKQAQKSAVERIDNERVRYNCKKCKYSFIYHVPQQRPSRCPYCSTPVQV